MNTKFLRRRSGVSIAEAAAALSLLLPLMVCVLYVVLESSYAYLIKTSLTEGARQAGRDLSIAYGQDPSISTDRTLQDVQVFDKIRIAHMINASEQFSDPVWDTSSSPPTVSVTCTYLSNQYSLPPFPNPDVLGLGASFTITANSTYRLE